MGRHESYLLQDDFSSCFSSSYVEEIWNQLLQVINSAVNLFSHKVNLNPNNLLNGLHLD